MRASFESWPVMRGTIKSGVEIEKLFKKGKTVRTNYVSARILAIPRGRDQDGRVAFIAGKRIGNAVYRNRCKRLMREMYYRLDDIPRTYEIVFIANRRTAQATIDQLDNSCERIVAACR